MRLYVNVQDTAPDGGVSTSPYSGSVCQVQRTFPPSPPLIGIELNPGPTPFSKAISAIRGDAVRDLVAASGAALGQTIAKTKKKKKTTATKTKSARSAFGPLSQSVSSSSTSPPVSMVKTIKTSARKHTVSIPFEIASLVLYSNASSSLVWGSPTSGIYHLPLDPLDNVGGQAVFGSAVQSVAGSFRQFRLRNMRFELLGQQPTSFAGSGAFALVNDGGISTGTSASYSIVAACDGSVSTTFWQNTTIPVTESSYNRDWLYLRDAVADGTAAERQQHAGVLATNALVTPTASIALAVLKMSGIVDFMDLAGAFTLVNFTKKKDLLESGRGMVRSVSEPELISPCNLCTHVHGQQGSALCSSSSSQRG